MTLWELAVERAGRSPNAALAISEGGSEVTFSELRERAANAAEWFGRNGVNEGQNVVWQLPTGVDAIILAVALSRLGAIQIPILPFVGRRELGHVFAQTGALILVVPSRWGEGNHDERDFVSQEFRNVRVLQMPSETEGGTADAPQSSCRDSHSWVFYTSGTTAAPKGTRHSEATLTACARGMVDRYEVMPSDRIAFVFQITHIGGIAWIYAALLSGCGLLLVEKFNREATWSLRRHGVTLAGAGLPFMHEYLAAQRTLPEGERLFPHVRAFTFGGMPKPPSIHYEIKRECGGAGVLGAYGMTEAPILTAAGPALSDDELANSEGPPMPGVELRVVGDDGKSVADGEVGELRVKAPQVMMGYLDSTLDAEAFDEDGYLRTGDLGRRDSSGNIVITGRLKDVIIRKGENVSAKEVEDALFAHPAVQDVSVVGLPDEVRGELVCAVIVSDDPSIDVSKIAAFLTQCGLMRQKIPERVELVDSLPRSESGKVDKKVLRRHYGGT
jgi:acyl-CoA synthetase (AMP-forming)/AMP-acid ligase II